MSTDGQFKVKQIVPGTQHYVLKSGAAVCEWGLLTNNNIDGSAVIVVSKLAAGSNNQVLATVSSTPTWANLTDAMHGSLSGGSLHAAVSNSAAGFAPAVGATGTVAYSTGSALAYASGVTVIDTATAVKATHFDGAGTVADVGAVRLPNVASIQFRNAGNTANLRGLYAHTDDSINLGHGTGVATTVIAASTTIANYIGANVALGITATGHTFKAGANEVASLTASIARWGHDTNVTTTRLAASTAVQALIGASTLMSLNTTFTWLGDVSAVPTTELRATTNIQMAIGANVALAINATGLTAKVGANTGWELTSSGVFVYNQADVNDYLQIASLDTYSYIYRRTNTGGAQTVFGCSTTAVDVGATTGVATTTLNAATTIASAIGGNRVTSATSDGFRVYDQSAVTKYANFTLDSAGLLVTMAAQTGETSALDIEIRGGDSVYPSDPGDVIIRPGVNSGDERGTLYLCGYPMQGITITKGAGSNSAVCIDATYEGFFGATPIAKPTVTGSRGGNAALASLCTELANLGLLTDSTS
jgi:hypothetical protein